MKIKGQTIAAWKEWLEGELTPPVHVKPGAQYVLEAFLEYIKMTEKKP